MVSINSLSIEGYNTELVPNTFFQQKEETEHGVIVFPGLGYTSQMPLLFYSSNLMLSLKADVLTVDYAYNRRQDFKTLNNEERARCFLADVQAAYQALLKQRSYKQITFIGKSLGTKAIGHIVTSETVSATVRAIWLTPLLKDKKWREQIKQYGGRSLFVSGTADPNYDAEYMKEVQEATKGQVVLIDEADHGLNIKDDVKRSIQALEKIMDSIKVFVTE
ncbi:MAG: hypothetical protein PHR77_18495 [Kiritimatiellae bacterium]|nr:hypothetical protein [Kiritimatiellia bacterium]MDD5523241.1 hypothetical protein [Kiritimatiellia bacterium]